MLSLNRFCDTNTRQQTHAKESRTKTEVFQTQTDTFGIPWLSLLELVEILSDSVLAVKGEIAIHTIFTLNTNPSYIF